MNFQHKYFGKCCSNLDSSIPQNTSTFDLSWTFLIVLWIVLLSKTFKSQILQYTYLCSTKNQKTNRICHNERDQVRLCLFFKVAIHCGIKSFHSTLVAEIVKVLGNNLLECGVTTKQLSQSHLDHHLAIVVMPRCQNIYH